MKDYFLEAVRERLNEIPEDMAAKHVPQIMLAIEREQAQAHPFWYAEHLLLQWWERTHAE